MFVTQEAVVILHVCNSRSCGNLACL